MKKIIALLLCLFMLLSMTACGRKNKSNADLNDIPAARVEEEENQPDTSDNAEDEIPEYDYETEREEVANNLRDAKELIENGDIEDATMIIKGLQTRTLTDDEKAQLKKLQEKMITVSD
ncbi:MAG: hypothetical protein IJN99_03825 [Clostridia bacterium]|nr:hypothetical protein [Clostridia bacterium]